MRNNENEEFDFKSYSGKINLKLVYDGDNVIINNFGLYITTKIK